MKSKSSQQTHRSSTFNHCDGGIVMSEKGGIAGTLLLTRGPIIVVVLLWKSTITIDNERMMDDIEIK